MTICPHCGDALIHETTVNASSQTISRDVCPRGTDFFSTAWALDGQPLAGAFTGSYVGQDFSLATDVTVTAGTGGTNGRLEETWIAGQDISGHRVVTPDANGHLVYRNPDPDWYGPCLLTLAAAAAGAEAHVALLGMVDETSWDWAPHLPVFLAPNGLLTQTAPAPPAVLVVVGVAASRTRLMLDPNLPIRQVA